MDAMEMYQVIATAVGSLGFPIVACVFLFRQNEKLEQRHEDESKMFATAISSLEKAVEKLTALLEQKG